jgi:ComF family protein
MVFQKKTRLIINSAKIAFQDFTDFFFQNLCHLCDVKLIRSRFVVCDECIAKLQRASEIDQNEVYSENFGESKIISNFYSKYSFTEDGDFQKLIHLLKYSGISKIGIQIGRELGKDLSSIDWFNRINVLIPVPLHRMKELERGYNQSTMICKGINEITEKPFKTKLIKRIRNTMTQTYLTREERKKNISEAFAVKDKSEIQNNHVALIDDVCTTGSTMSECAKVLMDNGASSVSLITSAIVHSN